MYSGSRRLAGGGGTAYCVRVSRASRQGTPGRRLVVSSASHSPDAVDSFSIASYGWATTGWRRARRGTPRRGGPGFEPTSPGPHILHTYDFYDLSYWRRRPCASACTYVSKHMWWWYTSFSGEMPIHRNRWWYTSIHTCISGVGCADCCNVWSALGDHPTHPNAAKCRVRRPGAPDDDTHK